jgi:hypothetical protein
MLYLILSHSSSETLAVVDASGPIDALDRYRESCGARVLGLRVVRQGTVAPTETDGTAAVLEAIASVKSRLATASPHESASLVADLLALESCLVTEATKLIERLQAA